MKAAGEIESRDVEKRLDYSTEERKSTRPDIDRNDVVFSDSDVSSFSILEEANETERKKVIRTLTNNISLISNEPVYDVKSVDIHSYKRKSDYVLEIFNKQGNKAYNKLIGNVDLVKAGAKSTMLHGFGKAKIATVTAIKTVIEKGNVISEEKDYDDKGYGRHIIAGKGYIYNKPSMLAVVVKAYPNTNSKFYLHEAEIIETDAFSMTGSLKSRDTVDASVSDNSIRTDKSKSQEETENFSEIPKNSSRYTLSEAARLSDELQKRETERLEKDLKRLRSLNSLVKNTFKYGKIRQRSLENAASVIMKAAGEIESRDVEKRLDYSTEERKSTRPDIDRTDVVFSDSDVSYDIGVLENGVSGEEVEKYSGRNGKKLDGKNLDKKKRTIYNEFRSIGMQWAYSTAKIGDCKTLFDGRAGKYKVIICTKEDVGFEIIGVIDSGKKENAERGWENDGRFSGRADMAVKSDRNRQGNRRGDSNVYANAGNETGNGGLSDRKSTGGRTGASESVSGYTEETSSVVKRSLGNGLEDGINSEADSKEPAFSMPPKKFSLRNEETDSEGNELTKEQQEFFKDSKVRDGDGNLLVVYHGTSQKFTVFDISAGRPDADVQGAFFSSDFEDAGGYGYDVGAYYLNLKNPADFDTMFQILKKYRSGDNAGIKIREELKKLGYDGVISEDEGYSEYVAFYPEQIKLSFGLTFSVIVDDSDFALSERGKCNVDMFIGSALGQ